MNKIENLTSYRRGLDKINASWSAFLAKRDRRLEQQRRHGKAAEKVAEDIIADLFTDVLDWSLAEINNQVRNADILLTRQGIKRLLIEAKRPGALAWNRRAVERALDQALRYAAEQKVLSVAVSDGCMIYAADVECGGLRDRVFAPLDAETPPESLWWLSVHGIYRSRAECEDGVPDLLPAAPKDEASLVDISTDALLHPKYGVPAECFAYVENAADPRTWKLPYRLVTGDLDVKRLPKAIQSILSNYRGAQVRTVPETAIPDVLARLARGAADLGRMPFQRGDAADIYAQLETALDQLGRLDEVKKYCGAI